MEFKLRVYSDARDQRERRPMLEAFARSLESLQTIRDTLYEGLPYELDQFRLGRGFVTLSGTVA